MTEQMAKDEIGKKQLDENFTKALRNRNHPAHEQAKKEWAELHKAAYPGEYVIGQSA